MNSGGDDDNQDLADMKILLNSWHVDILYERFKEEDIGINELKMMEINHVKMLLENYKIGVRIRFEYNLNNWRNKMGLPLKTENINQHVACACHYEKYQENMIENNIETKRKGYNPDHQDFSVEQAEYEGLQAPTSPQSGKSDTSLTKELNGDEIENVTTLKSPRIKTNNTDDETEEDNAPFNILADILSYTSKDEKPPKFPSKPTPDKCPVHLAEILQISGNRGLSILKFYEEKKRLTNNHRSQLIQTIVEFFDENDYHLSLNVSHYLEWEILKMFPTEKLEYYRTEKRGKIYVKYTNMKRYKRDRRTKKKVIDLHSHRLRRSQPTQNSNQKDGVLPEKNPNLDTIWPMCTEPEVEVKQEDSIAQESKEVQL